MSFLEIQNLTIAHRGGLVAAFDFSLRLSCNSGLILAGPIGSGKSSILRAVAGLLDYQGEIFWGGKNLREVDIRERNFVYASFDSPLFVRKSVEYNLAYGLRLRKQDESEIAVRVKEVAQSFSITELLKCRVKTLSPTEKRLVIVARALMRNADLYLFNDIARGLNEEISTEILAKLSRLANNSSVLIATSDYSQAIPLGFDIAIIKEGKLHCSGSANFFKNSPPDTFTKLFTTI